MHRNQSASAHQFTMIPQADVPRSAFDREMVYKTTFDAGKLVPFFVDEVLPGDSFKLNLVGFGRLSTPIFPIMDNMYLDTFFFYVPFRILWANWKKFNGEQRNPGDSTSFVIPQIVSKAGGYDINSVFDYMGLPTANTLIKGENTFSHSALFLRAYNRIYNEWFRDENLQNSVPDNTGDGPDLYTDYTLLSRGKRKDYFTSCLPWPQKGTSVSLPLGATAPVKGDGITPFQVTLSGGGNVKSLVMTNGASSVTINSNATSTGNMYFNSNTGLFADLSQATAATINQLRQSFQIQRLLERDARGGTRYTEIIRAHFGVISPDARLQRPEYLGGTSELIQVNPIAQTSGTGVPGQSTPQGNLSAMSTVLTRAGFSQSFTEHGCIIGIVSMRADLTYQQGLDRMWSRQTRFDFYWPAFAMLGEQAVLNKEIYCDGSANDNNVFGYQERWAEYRYLRSKITGKFRSGISGTLDAWHLSQFFGSLPTLNSTFITENPPVSRVLAAGALANGQQIIFDAFIKNRAVRPMPLYSAPGLIDHF